MASAYYNSYTPKHGAANLPYGAGQPWNWTTNYPPNHQFLTDMETPPHHHHQMYYNPHMFHSAVAANVGSEWHSPGSTAAVENYAQNMPATAHQLLPPHLPNLGFSGNGGGGVGGAGGSGLISGGSTSSISSGPASGNNSHLSENNINTGQHQHQPQPQQQQPHIVEGLPSPPITVSGSELSSPGAPVASSSPHLSVAHSLNNSGSSIGTTSSHNISSGSLSNISLARNNSGSSSPTKHRQFYDWMKKPAYPAQPQPGKTRTKDKYRVVYTDYQRLELEKEYCTSRYITIRRKSELASLLSLSERQVKIWFQNRRAKERKQTKKNIEGSAVQHSEYMLDSKKKLESGLHLQHPLHTMNPMAAMGMPMRLPAHLTAHTHSLAAHQFQQHNAQMSAAAAAASVGVGSLSM